MIFDGKLLSAPTIRSVIRDKAVITGQFTAAEAEVIVNVLNARQRSDAKGSKTATSGAAAPGADQAKPGAPIDAEKLRRLAWGPAATNGLRAACYFEPTKEVYADGEVAKRLMVLHNSGKESVRFDVGLGGHDDGWTVVDEQGRKVRLDHVAYAELVPAVTFVLEPGHATEIECMSTGMGASTKAAYPADTAIQAKPGTTCRARWTVRVIETERKEEQNSVTIKSVWHGTLTTGELRVRIGSPTSQTTPQANSKSVASWPTGFRAKEEWEDAGASTPEAALQTLLWAAREKALARFDEMVFLPRRPDDGWYGSYTNDVPYVIGRIKQCLGATIEDVKYDGSGVAVIQIGIDGIPTNQAAVNKNIRMIQLGTEWKCDYPHDSLVAFKIHESEPSPKGSPATKQAN
jgi:hypothetical protein